jgi:hypothetical protein
LPSGGGGGERAWREKFIGRKRKTGYTPSFNSVLFGVYGKTPKQEFFTELSERPMPLEFKPKAFKLKAFNGNASGFKQFKPGNASGFKAFKASNVSGFKPVKFKSSGFKRVKVKRGFW